MAFLAISLPLAFSVWTLAWLRVVNPMTDMSINSLAPASAKSLAANYVGHG